MQKILYYSEMKDSAVDWVFKFFSMAIGCAFQSTSEPHLAAVVYTNGLVDVEQLRIPIWHKYYDSTAEHCLGSNGYWVPREMRDAEAPVDYVGLVFRLLTLVDELTIPTEARERFGNLLRVNFPRSEFRNRPMVDEAVQALKQQLVERGFLQESELLQRWPGGKHYAILLTHDTDGPCLLEPMELAKAGVKAVIRRDKRHMQTFLEGSRRLITGGPDPYFNFSHWATFEQALGATSAFYIYVKSKGVPNHLNNPVYHVKKTKAKWNILHELVDRGWEIGLHSSIYGLEKDEYIRAEKSDLEDFLGKPIVGNRGHYWRINWRNPTESFRRLEAAGMIYDCSMAWKDSPGFRSGTVIPYHPYDAARGAGLKLLQIPTSIMDGHLFEYQKESNPHTWFALIVEHVRSHGGVLNLNWHTRTWVDKFWYVGWKSCLAEELVKLAETGEAWFTTPRDLSKHWLAREQQLATD